MSETTILLFWLLVGHAVADYPLQGDFLARAKNHRAPVVAATGIAFPPWIALWMHALMHGGAVALVTRSAWLGIAETVVHAGIDYRTCNGGVSYSQDQALHIACKVLWIALILTGVAA